MRRFVGGACAALLLTACAAQHSRGTVAMKITDTQAHVCVGKESVTPGTRLEVLRNVCEGPKQTCKLTHVGQGSVTDVLNEHYSVAEFPAAIRVREGDLIEVQK
jgi:hypothetical protein